MSQRKDVTELSRAVRAGDRRALAKAITLVESERELDRARATSLLADLMEHAGRAFRIGVTGAPGVGKSTLVDALGVRAVAEGRRVAVLAIDPSSIRSGGSLLGDRTRMGRLAALPEAFVRPSPASGAQGGIGPRTRETLLVLEAAGYDVVIIETVGVGQGELAVTDVADVVVVLWMAGAGDDVQGMKRGILEHADAVVFTKADGPNLEESQRSRDRLQALFSVFRREPPDVLALSAFFEPDAGLLWDTLSARRQQLAESGELEQRRRAQRLAWFHLAVKEALLEKLSKSGDLDEERARLRAGVERGELLPAEAARRLIEGL